MRRLAATLGFCLLACTPHGAAPQRAPAAGASEAACAGPAPVPRPGKVRPFVDLPLRVKDLSAFRPSPDGRVVAAVGKDETLLFDALHGHALRVLPFPVLGWFDARHFYRRAGGAIEVHDVDPDLPLRTLPDRPTDRLPLPLRNGAWLERSERGGALVDGHGELLHALPPDDLEATVAVLRSQLGGFLAATSDGDPTDIAAAFDGAQPSSDLSKLGVRLRSGHQVEVLALDDPRKPRAIGRVVTHDVVLEFVPTPDGRYVVAHLAKDFALKEKATCGHRLARLAVGPVDPDDGYPAPSESVDLASFEPAECVRLLPLGTAPPMLLQATSDIVLSSASGDTLARDLHTGKELWYARSRAAALAPGGRALTMGHRFDYDSVESRDLVTGRGGVVHDARTRSAGYGSAYKAAVVAARSLLVDYDDDRPPTAWSLADGSAAPATDAQRAALAPHAGPSIDVPREYVDSKLCDELACGVELLAAAPELGAVVVALRPHQPETREVGEAIQFRAGDGKTIRTTVQLPGVLEGSALSEDHRRFAVLVRAPSQMFGTAIDRLPWLVDVYDVATGARVAESPDVFGGTTVALSPDGFVAYAGARDGTTFAFAGGRELWHAPASGGAVSAVLVDPSGSVVVTASADGAFRVFDAHTGALRATLAEYDDGEWLAATPGGAFEGTPEVAPRVGYVFEPTFDFFSFAQLPDRFRDPATVRRRLAGEAVDLQLDLASPPELDVLGEPAVSAGRARLRVSARSSERVDTLRAYVDGRLAATRAVCRADAAVDVDVSLLSGRNRVSVVAFDERGLASNALVRDVVSPPGAGARPAVRFLSVGVSKYAELAPSFQLPAAVHDATAVAEALRGATGDGKPFASASGVTLLDDQATPAAIDAALSALADAGPDDLAVVFFAGHGVEAGANGEMRFVTGRVHAEPDGAVKVASIPEASIGWDAVGGALARVRGRALVLLDACHSGHMSRAIVAPNDGLAVSLVHEHRAGAIVFAAAKGRQESFESGGGGRGLVLDARGRAWTSADEGGGHGYFTGALVAALGDPAADLDGDGAIEVGELIDVVTDRVNGVTHGQQTPWVVRRELFGDFPLALAGGGAAGAGAPSDRPVAAPPADARPVNLDFGGRMRVVGYRVVSATAEKVEAAIYVRPTVAFGPGWALRPMLRDKSGYSSSVDGHASGPALAPQDWTPDTTYEIDRSFALGPDWKGDTLDLVLYLERGDDKLRIPLPGDAGIDDLPLGSDDDVRVARFPRPR